MLVSFGSAHSYTVSRKGEPNRFLNTDTLARVKDRESAFKLFGNKFCTTYEDDYLSEDQIKLYFSRGIIDIDDNDKVIPLCN